jgi:hypothetical protein
MFLDLIHTEQVAMPREDSREPFGRKNLRERQSWPQQKGLYDLLKTGAVATATTRYPRHEKPSLAVMQESSQGGRH